MFQDHDQTCEGPKCILPHPPLGCLAELRANLEKVQLLTLKKAVWRKFEKVSEMAASPSLRSCFQAEAFALALPWPMLQLCCSHTLCRSSHDLGSDFLASFQSCLITTNLPGSLDHFWTWSWFSLLSWPWTYSITMYLSGNVDFWLMLAAFTRLAKYGGNESQLVKSSALWALLHTIPRCLLLPNNTKPCHFLCCCF